VPVPSEDLDFQRHMSWSLCAQWVQLRWEVIIGFADIGGIDDHHYLHFLFITLVYFWCILYGQRLGVSFVVREIRVSHRSVASNKFNHIPRENRRSVASNKFNNIKLYPVYISTGGNRTNLLVDCIRTWYICIL
jgi:hypothetical protein